MKSKEYIVKRTLAVLTELEQGNICQAHRSRLEAQLEVLYEIAEEDIPEEYWDRIEDIIYL